MELATRIDHGPRQVTLQSRSNILQCQDRGSAALDGSEPFDKRTVLQSPTRQQCVERWKTHRQARPFVRPDKAGRSTTELAQGAKCLDTLFVSLHRTADFPAALRMATTLPTIRRS